MKKNVVIGLMAISFCIVSAANTYAAQNQRAFHTFDIILTNNSKIHKFQSVKRASFFCEDTSSIIACQTNVYLGIFGKKDGENFLRVYESPSNHEVSILADQCHRAIEIVKREPHLWDLYVYLKFETTNDTLANCEAVRAD